MELALIKSITPLLLPPGGNLALMLAGVVLARWHRRSGHVCVWLGALSLYLLSTYAVSDALYSGLASYPAVTAAEVRGSGAGAIVVLGGGRYPRGPEFGAESIAGQALERVRYGAYLHRETGLPLLMTGGRVHGEANSEASLMAASAGRDFGVSVRWQEQRARNTAENARYTRELLAAEGIDRIVLVSSAHHLYRAVAVFRAQGFTVLPAPTVLDTRGDGDYGVLSTVLPGAGPLAASAWALHEYLGRLWYRLRYQSL